MLRQLCKVYRERCPSRGRALAVLRAPERARRGDMKLTST